MLSSAGAKLRPVLGLGLRAAAASEEATLPALFRWKASVSGRGRVRGWACLHLAEARCQSAPHPQAAQPQKTNPADNELVRG